MTEVLGWIGTFFFATCAIPEAYASFRRKWTAITWGMLLMWLTGEVCTMIYVFLTTKDPILLTNYVFNLLCLLIIIYYKICGKAS